MDPTWINALVTLASFLTLLTSILIGYLFRLSNELATYKTHVAVNYATKPEVKDLTERLEQQMQIGFDRLYNTLNNNNKRAS
ncbi:MAG: hypothetical protein ACJAT7_002057 [Psychromonas sp.]|jgi:hypothetical protein|uniref:hypothetical protein n=1 Tax=Psychromonas sp. TaxID=1884585 RepID=UPI0039E40D2C